MLLKAMYIVSCLSYSSLHVYLLASIIACLVVACVHMQTCDRLQGRTYDKLRGTNLTTMLSYYTSLQLCLDKGATTTEVMTLY